MTWIHRQSFRAALAVLAVLAVLATAHAQPSQEAVARYTESVQRGTELFTAGHFSAARRAFLRAYVIHPKPVLLFNIASTFRREGRLEEAVEAYRSYLAAADDSTDSAQIALARKTIAELEERLPLEREPEAEPQPAPTKPSESLAVVAPEANVANAAFRRGANGPTLDLRPQEPDVDRGGELSALRITGIGVASAGAVALTWAGYEALSFRSARSKLGDVRQWDEEDQALYDRSRSARTRALWLAGTGAAAATAGVVLYVLGGDKRSRDRAIHVSPAVSGQMTGAVVSGRF